MVFRVLMSLLLGALWTCAALAQPTCPPTPVYSPCDLVLELSADELAQHPNPHATVRITAEFRSPGTRTFPLIAFWDGGNRFVVRFAPTDPGRWLVRFTGNIPRINGTMATVEATDAAVPGFLEPANLHHWRTSKDRQPHLWMGDTLYSFASMPEETFQAILAARKQQGFTHIRGYLLGARPDNQPQQRTFALPAADAVNPAHFQQVDRRIRAMNDAGMVVDLVLGWDKNHLAEALPTVAQRRRYLDYVIGRYSAFRVTWQLVQEFEEYTNGRAFVKELGEYLKAHDPYQHPRTTHTLRTTSPLAKDGWMTYMLYQSSDNQLGAIEHQLYQMPFVNAEFGYENSGAGASHTHHVDADTFRKRLWNATMDGQHPTYGNTGVYGGSFDANARFAESPGAQAMKVWRGLMERTRYWELEPYFDVSGARCLGLHGEDTPQFLCYVETGGSLELRFVRRNSFKAEWINPADGTVVPLKEFKDDLFAGAPPSPGQDWLLHVYREGRLGSLKSYKFESRYVPVQDPDNATARVPYEVTEPAAMEVPVGDGLQAPFAIRLTRESRASSRMMYLWVAENTIGGQGHRIAGVGDKGFLQFQKEAVGALPSVVNIRVYGLNAVGKLYFVDKVYRLTP
ncbi:MAG: DUF4038 domain-containing protein [Bryobacterales bacterium]|jgi:hypothetical protein|nr:DUF4038 domain-containing protein [Bryobacterales bacterium]